MRCDVKLLYDVKVDTIGYQSDRIHVPVYTYIYTYFNYMFHSLQCTMLNLFVAGSLVLFTFIEILETQPSP